MPGISDMTLLKNEPVECNGIRLYPITMAHYEEWQRCKGVLTLRMSTLPALYAVMPYLGALYAMDTDTFKENGKAVGFMGTISYILCLSMNIPVECAPKLLTLVRDAKDERKLTSVIIKAADITVTIPVHKFNAIRETIAKLNGEELPNEAENPDLIQAQNDINANKRPKLKYNSCDMIASVALQFGIRQSSVLEWTIREFESAKRAIVRDKGYETCGIAESNGTTWKGGNPYPSWMLDREEDIGGGFMSEADMLGKLGKVGTIKKG